MSHPCRTVLKWFNRISQSRQRNRIIPSIGPTRLRNRRLLETLEPRLLFSGEGLAPPPIDLPGQPAALTANTTLTWDGDAGDQNWSNPVNWDINGFDPTVYPKNDIIPGVTFSAIIPDGFTVHHDTAVGTNQIVDITLGNNASLILDDTTSLTIQDEADIAGIIDAEGGDFTAAADAEFVGNRARVFAEGGSQVDINAAAYSSTGLGSTALFSASGSGTTIDLSGLVSIDGSFSDIDNFTQKQVITATDGGTVDLSGVQEILAPVDGLDRLEIVMSDGSSSIDLSGAQRIGTGGGPVFSSTFTGGAVKFILSGGATISLPAVDTLKDVYVDATSSAQFLVNGVGPAVALDTRGLTGTIYKADGVGSLIDLSRAIIYNGGFDISDNFTQIQAVTVINGASIDMSTVQQIVAPEDTRDRFDLYVDSSGTELLLNALNSIDGSSDDAFVNFYITGGGVVEFGDLDYQTRGSISLAGGSTARLSGLQSSTGNAVTIDIDSLADDFDVNGDLQLGNSINIFTGTGFAASTVGGSHTYTPVIAPSPLTWDDARLAAEAAGGFLATITSQAENDYVFGLIDDPSYWTEIAPWNGGPVLGGFRDPGAPGAVNNWAWVTGERFDYTNWMSGQPGNPASDNPKLQFVDDTLAGRSPRWNDFPETRLFSSYIVETIDVGAVTTPVISIAGDFLHAHTNPENTPLASSILAFDGSSPFDTPQRLELGGNNVNPAELPILGHDNFGFGQMIIGQGGGSPTATYVRLEDLEANGDPAGDDEALYLFGESNLTTLADDALRILGGSTLNISYLDVYAYIDRDAAGTTDGVRDWVNLQDLFPVGVDQIAFDEGWIVREDDSARPADILVASSATDQILRYHGTKGTFVEVFVDQTDGGANYTLDNPLGMTFGPDGNLYVSSYADGGRVLVFDDTGTFIESIGGGIDPAQPRLSQPRGLAFGPDGNLYVANFDNDGDALVEDVFVVDMTDSARPLDIYGDLNDDGDPVNDGGYNFQNVNGIVFDDNGDLYIADTENDPAQGSIVKLHGPASAAPGSLIATVLSAADGDPLLKPWGMAIKDGLLYISNWRDTSNSTGGTGDLLRWDPGTDTATLFELTDTNVPLGLAFGPSGDLYLANKGFDNVNRYDGQTLAPITPQPFASGGGLNEPTAIAFFPFETAPINLGSIQGTKFEDINGNGIRDRNVLLGNPPDVQLVIDVSGSTATAFGGTPVGDINGDGSSNTILDAELAGFIALNNEMIARGFGNIANVAVTVFGSGATGLDMDPDASGIQLSTNPQADNNNNGIADVEDVLRAVLEGAAGVDSGSTNFEAALQQSVSTFTSLGTASGNGNLVFFSDGVNNDGGTFTDEVAQLQSNDTNILAFGIGSNASLSDLRLIDPNAAIVTSTDQLISLFTIQDNSQGNTEHVEPGLEGVTIYLDLNNNGMIDSGEPSTLTSADNLSTPNTDETGEYRFDNLAPGTYIVREVVPAGYTQTAPASGFYEVILAQDDTVTGLDFGNREPGGTLQGYKFSDSNADGVRDSGEPGLAGVTIYLDSNNDGDRDPGELFTITMTDDTGTPGIDESGLYRFEDLPAGNYIIREEVPANYSQTAPASGFHDVALTSGQTITGLDFGNTQENLPPVIGALTDSPDPVYFGQTLTLEATGVSDDSSVASLSFYRDANNNGVGDSGELLGTDTIGIDGWQFSTTVNWSPGTHTYLAQATDDGVPLPVKLSDWVSTTGVVLSGLIIDVGSHDLLANTPGQKIDLFVTGGAPVTGFNLRAQLGDGDGGDPEPSFDMPADFTGGIWDAHPNTVTAAQPFGNNKYYQSSVTFDTQGDEVSGSGQIVTISVDTTGFGTVGQMFDLKLENTQIGQDSDFVGILPVIINGNITIVQGAEILNRSVFYNDSFFDGYDPSAGVSDYGAIASSPSIIDPSEPTKELGKQALLPGQAASYMNYTSYSKGINGIMIDIRGVVNAGGLTLADFEFKTGNDNNPAGWAAAPQPAQIDVRPHPTDAGMERVTLIWNNNNLDGVVDANEAVAGAWLQVTVKANGNTGLQEEDVFYFGNAPGETGNSALNTFVDGTDFANTRDNPHTFLDRAPIEDPYDHNRDSFVDGTDLGIIRDNSTNFQTDLVLFTAPSLTATPTHTELENNRPLLAAINWYLREQDGDGKASIGAEAADQPLELYESPFTTALGIK